MRIFKILLALAVLCIGFEAAAAQSVRFFSAMNDIPLMEGLDELEGQGFIFDKAEGRIGALEAQSTHIKAAEALNYYATSLPQFGWAVKSKNPLTFRREGEQMVLNAQDTPQGLWLKIQIGPAQSGLF